jgi:hypothetical protein
MNYNFQNESQIRIPAAVYRPYKRCEFCQSVYLTDNLCESCGRSVRYDLIGPLFGYKSFYGIKERYLKQLPLYVRLYPLFENTRADRAKSFVRQLQKRLGDLVQVFDEHDDKKLLFVEACEIINELLFFGVPVQVIRNFINENLEMERHLLEISEDIIAKKFWIAEVMSYRLAGAIRIKFVLQTLTLMALLLFIFSWQFGK